jgi:nicotinamidase-related amidase
VIANRSLTCSATPWDFEFLPESTALLVIDMQNDFCALGGYLHQFMEQKGMGDEAVKALREPIAPLSRVVQSCREAKVAVIYTIESHRPDLADVPSNKMEGSVRVGAPIGSSGPLGRLLVQNERGSEVVDELKPVAGEHIVHKPGKCAFFATELDSILRIRGITHLVISGVTTDCCVFGTLMEARDRGYHTLQLEDCCAAVPRASHDAICELPRAHPQAFGVITNSEAFVKAMESTNRLERRG